MHRQQEKEWLDLLRKVARSFYLTVRILPVRVRRPIGLAYLLARATDSVADTDLLPLTDRLETLDRMGQAIAQADPASSLPFWDRFQQHQADRAEAALLARWPDLLQWLAQTPPEDRADIQWVLRIILSGQRLDLERFENRQPPQALETEADLIDYTYRVAGCVGEFWTRICRRHLFPRARLDETQFFQDAVHFGQGLQLVNVLRDLPQDLRRGRFYLPMTELQQRGVCLEDLRAGRKWGQVRPVYLRWWGWAVQWLEAGWRYTITIPWSQIRVRLACAWPILLGGQTLQRLHSAAQSENFLNLPAPIKVSRNEVWRMIRQTIWLYPFPRRWEGLWDRMNWAKYSL